MTQYRVLTVLILSGFLGMFSPFLPSTSVARAAGTIKIDDVRSVSVGMGLRTSFNMIEDGAPNGTDRSKDFVLDSFRFYLSGQILPMVSFEFNTDYSPLGVVTDVGPPAGGATTEDIRVLDGVLKFGFNDLFNVWVGRFLPPTDRSNLSGPYYLNGWDFPIIVQRYPNIFAGRDDGAAVWGQIGGGKFKYQVGAFQGIPNEEDNLLYAGRLTFNFWDPEPGYYNSSTYYGSMNVLAIGLVAMTQKAAVGPAGAAGDFTGWSVDLLAERNLGGAGVATVEGAYYDYDNDGLAPEGSGYMALISYLFPGKIGTGAFQGQFQPLVRYQNFETDGPAGVEHTRLDVGLSYVISGHNARITATYSQEDPGGAASDFDSIKLGLQFHI